MQKECENDRFASLSEHVDLGSGGHGMVQPLYEKLTAPKWRHQP